MKEISFYESFPTNDRNLKTRRLVCGFGINDAPFSTQFHHLGKLIAHPAYLAWKSLITRCYNNKYQSKYPSYSGVTVCEEWRSFMAFRSWWLDNQVEGWHIDKDILSSSRQYSPSTCIFIPSSLNMFLTDSAASRGRWMIGCSMTRTGKFTSYINNPLSGKKETLGSFELEIEAHNKWMERKIEIAGEMKAIMDSIDERIYGRVVELIKLMK